MQKKKIVLVLCMVFLVCVSAFAQGKGGAIGKLDTWGEKIVSLFTSTWLKAICIVALISICIGMIVAGRNEPGLIKKFIPWLIGTIVLLSASDIVKYFFNEAGSDAFNISFLTNQLKVFLG